MFLVGKKRGGEIIVIRRQPRNVTDFGDVRTSLVSLPHIEEGLQGWFITEARRRREESQSSPLRAARRQPAEG